MSRIEQRVDRLRERLAKNSLHGILVTNLANVQYLSGFTGTAGTCLILMDKAYFISDGRYLIQSEEQVKGMHIVIGREPHPEIIKNNGLIPNGLSLGFEGDHLVVGRMNQIEEFFPGCQWISTSRFVEELAAVKDETELGAIRSAVEITDKTFEQIVPELRPGATERGIASKISYLYKMLGAQGDAFDPIVAAGPNSALPHAVPTDREFQAGDFVILDFGARYGGYCADMTRTVVIGNATDRHREVYDVVREAQSRGCEAATDGISCRELDSATRDYITEKGYEEFFVHNTGHGLGREVHTMPRLSQSSKDTLLENYVVTIEPGIYIKDWGGVRIEDDVLIKKDGCEILNRSTKELLILR
ncbi:MAG: aminopeptidase P family protein [Candidatus Neomarinimicrobiota bacterium]